MPELLTRILTGQFEASLCMFNQCVQACRPEHWEGKIANDSFRQVAYHTLFFLDLYLSSDEDAFELRDFHHRGGDEREPVPSVGLTRDETLAYIPLCRQKMLATFASETRETLEGPSGFSYRRISRAELHIYNLRHLQHHTGQLSAYLRRVDEALKMPTALPWVGSGWR
jgi:hypothetical protein